MAEKCMICGSMREVLTKNHLKEHEITMEEYRERFGKCKWDNQAIMPPKQLREQFNSEKYVEITGRQSKPTWINGEWHSV